MGRIALEGVTDLSAVSPYAPLGFFHISFRKQGTTLVLYDYDFALDTTAGSAFGTFSLLNVSRFRLFNVAPGFYDVTIKGAKNLRVSLPGVFVGDTTILPDVSLPAGDANNDNSVDSTDFGLLIGAFNTSATLPGNGYDPACDFNFDGSVDSTDFGLLIGNYGQSGAL